MPSTDAGTSAGSRAPGPKPPEARAGGRALGPNLLELTNRFARARRRGLLPSGAAILLTALLLAAGPGRPDQAGAGIWMFDFRDTFYDVEFLKGREAVIVGDRGHILVSHEKYPNLWALHEQPSRELLTCVSFVDVRNGWAAGHGGIIIHSADGGRSWKVQRPPDTDNQPLFDIQFVSEKIGFACGASDSFLKTEDGGASWRELPPGEEVTYNSLGFLDAQSGYLVGEFGTVLSTADGGTSWQKLDLADYQGSLFGVQLLSARTLLVFGIAGRLMRSDDGGGQWTQIPSGTRSSLFRAAAHGDEVVVVGASGAILYSRDGGRSFQLVNEKEFTTFAGVSAHPDGGFLCVGERGSIYRFHRPNTDRVIGSPD